MNSFLSKISQLHSILDVILLSHRGDPLFLASPDTQKDYNNRISCWKQILNEFNHPHTLDAIFHSGRCYLVKSEIGYLIISMTSDKDLHRIKQACESTLPKLQAAPLRKKVLLKMLTESHDTVKPYIIKELMPVADSEVAALLISLLQQEADFHEASREQLQLFICQALGHCNSYEAIEPLNSFLASHKADPDAPLNEEIREAVRISIQQLKNNVPKQSLSAPGLPTEKVLKVPAKATSAAPAPAHDEKEIVAADIPMADEITGLARDGKKEEALTLISELIEEYARKKDFTTAEHLHKRMMQIDSMALTRIVKAAEIIEEEKVASIDQNHLKVWKDLTELLTGEEFGALYHKMALKTFPAGEMIATSGNILNTLMFINDGRVQIQATQQDVTIPLKIKGKGEIIGGSSFFEASVWTFNAKSQGAELFLLTQQDLDELTEEYPSLKSKLSHFCTNFETTSALLKRIRKNRRQYERQKITGRLSFAVLDREGEETGIVAKGELLDISRGGVAFSIHSAQKKNAVGLFGRNLRVSINAGMSAGLLVRNGVVRAVKDQDLIGNDYSLHIKFDTTLTSAEMQQAIDASGT